MGRIQRRLLKSVLLIVAHPRLTLVVCGALLAASVLLALFKLEVNTDQDRLFSPRVGFFQTYLEFEHKFPENEALYVLIEPKDKSKPPAIERWTQLADRLSQRLRGLTQVVERVEDGVPIDQLGNQALLFADQKTLKDSFKAATDQLSPLARVWASGGQSPMKKFLTLMQLAPADDQQAQFITLLADSWKQSVALGKPAVPDMARLNASDPSDLGYSYLPDQSDPTNHVLLVATYLKDDTSYSGGFAQVLAVRAATAEVAKDFPEFHVATTGRPALDADEMLTSDADSTRAEVIALIVVFAGLVIFLRSVWMAAAAEISLAVSIGWTFGWATLSVGELNLLSLVFLITLIGIGMDYLVQILSRYRREAPRYIRPAAVWARVFKHVSPPICTACLGAAGAFFVSVFTDFRGASELGIIAGGGLLLCLAGGYTVLPAILTIWPPKMPRVDPNERYEQAEPKRSMFRRLAPPAAWLICLAIVLPFARRIYFNPNLLEMQAQNLESVQLVRKLQTWSAVVMSQNLDELRKVRDKVLPSPTVASTDSLLNAQDNYQWLQAHQNQLPTITWNDPPAITPDEVKSIALSARFLASHMESANFAEAGAALRSFADAADKAKDPQVTLTQWQAQFILQLKGLLSRFSPSPLNVHTLPAQLKNHLVSADGTYALYIEPKDDLWKRGPLKTFVLDVEDRMQQPGFPPLTGIAPQIYHSTRYIETAFYKATAYALGLVIILVFLDLRNIGQTLLTISVLGLGLPMLVGLMGLLGINWNFANFFGLPILIGAGHEYGVFMVHRYRERLHDPRRVWSSWDTSDKALLLCAFVTSSAFAFFWWLGHHEGLKSLGLVMSMGTACIYLSALLVVRPILKWRIDRAGHSSGKSATQ